MSNYNEIVERIWEDSEWEYDIFFDRAVVMFAKTPNGFIVSDTHITPTDEQEVEEGEDRIVEMMKARIKRRIKTAMFSGKYPDYFRP